MARLPGVFQRSYLRQKVDWWCFHALADGEVAPRMSGLIAMAVPGDSTPIVATSHGSHPYRSALPTRCRSEFLDGDEIVLDFCRLFQTVEFVCHRDSQFLFRQIAFKLSTHGIDVGNDGRGLTF